MTSSRPRTPRRLRQISRIARLAAAGPPWALLLAGVAATALLLMPSLLAPYPLLILSYILVYAIAGLALNFLYGTAGSLSLGHATYFGVAAYAGAFMYRFSFVDSLELYLAFGILTAVLFAAAIGFFCVRTTKIQFAILTLAFSMLVHSVVVNGAIFRLLGGVGWALYLLGGGSMYLPRLTFLGAQVAPGAFVPVFFRVIVAGFLASALALWTLSRSPFGGALRAIRDNETRAAFIGIRVRQYRWAAFVVSGLFMGLAGSLYGQLARQITPDQLHWLLSAQLVIVIVLGGTRRFLGPVLGACVYVGLEEWTSHLAVGRYFAFGVLLIVVVRAFPAGMAGACVGLWEWARRAWGAALVRRR